MCQFLLLFIIIFQMGINTVWAWPYANMKCLLRFSYITFAQIWNSETFSEAGGHENTVNWWRTHTQINFWILLTVEWDLFHSIWHTPLHHSNGTGSIRETGQYAHAALLLNCECQLFAANIFKSVRWLDVHDAGDTDGKHQTNYECHKYTRPNWCGRESNAVDCRIETFTSDVRLSLWMEKNARKEEVKNEKVFNLFMCSHVISEVGPNGSNWYWEKWGSEKWFNEFVRGISPIYYMLPWMREKNNQ